MPITPPDPGTVARILRDQLEQIRILIEMYPREPAYPAAAEYVEAAITKLEGVSSSTTP